MRTNRWLGVDRRTLRRAAGAAVLAFALTGTVPPASAQSPPPTSADKLKREREIINRKLAERPPAPAPVAPKDPDALTPAEEKTVAKALTALERGDAAAADAAQRELAAGGWRFASRALGLLDHRDDTVQVRAANLFAEVRDARANPSLVRLTNDRSTAVRAAAARALGQIGDPAAVPALAWLLGDRAADVRQSAVAAFRGVGAPALPALFEALGDAEAVRRSNAAAALGAIGDRSAAAALAEVLVRDREGTVRESAARALRGLREPSSVGALVQALADGEPGVRRDAAGALGAIGAPRAVAPLVEAMADEYPQVRESAAAALVAITGAKVDPSYASWKAWLGRDGEEFFATHPDL
jgi:HEAT repeat protein